jgi:ABC-type glutathione transport system ATPase component
MVKKRADPNELVNARDVSVRYRANGSSAGFLAVRGVTLRIGPGEIVGLVGESGAGKSTLAMTIAGQAGAAASGDRLPEISGGRLSVVGHELRRAGKRRLDRVTLSVGYLAQDGAERLNPQFSVVENVAEPIFLRDRRFSIREANTAVATLIDALRLPLGVMQKLPYELSSGQRQRVALARALILEPKLLVADEPARGIDDSVRSGVLGVLAELRAERQFSALIVSSTWGDLARVATRIAVMHRGIIVGMGSVDEIFDGPHHPYLEGLVRHQSSISQQEEASAS